MLYLKEANVEDAKEEYQFLMDTPENENGFENRFHGSSYEEFVTQVIPSMINSSLGIDLAVGRVPQTFYFLWDENVIVGLFKFRTRLNEVLRAGAGHIGYGIHKDHRNKGYASKGLALVIEKAKDIILEDEIYLSVHIDNPHSLQVQLNNQAYIHHSDDIEHHTRIKIR